MGLESVKNMTYERGRFINQHAKAWVLYKQPWEMGYLNGKNKLDSSDHLQK